MIAQRASVVAVALAAVAFAGSCGMAKLASPVARDPGAYSEDERLSEIDRLDGIIASEMGALGLGRAEPMDDTTMRSKPPDGTTVTVDEPKVTADDDEDDARPEPGAPPVLATESGSSSGGEKSWCDRVCDSTRAICEAAEKICRIADSMPGHPTARDRCTRARGDCTTAKDSARACDCRGL